MGGRGIGVYCNDERQTSVIRQNPVLTHVIVFFLLQAPRQVACYPRAGWLSQDSPSPREGPTQGPGNGPHHEVALVAFVWNNSAPMIPHSCLEILLFREHEHSCV